MFWPVAVEALGVQVYVNGALPAGVAVAEPLQKLQIVQFVPAIVTLQTPGAGELPAKTVLQAR